MSLSPCERRCSVIVYIVPLFPFLVAVYGAYTIGSFLLDKSWAGNIAQAQAVAMVTVFAVLFFLWLLPFVRILLLHLSSRKYLVPRGSSQPVLEPEAVVAGLVEPPAGVERFYLTKAVFACDRVGLPRWCVHCDNWKADRVHHSSELERCVERMDHFCPWIGGMVCAKNYKYFLQFLFYAFLFTSYTVAVTAWGAWNVGSKNELARISLLVLVTLGAMMLFFSSILSVFSFILASKNLTTVENIELNKKVRYIAIAITEAQAKTIRGPIVTWPFSIARATNDFHVHPGVGLGSPPMRSIDRRSSSFQARTNSLPSSAIGAGSADHSAEIPSQGEQAAMDQRIPNQNRYFAILQVPIRKNPFDLGGVIVNMRQVLGRRVFPDWFVPWSESPLLQYRDGPMGEFASVELAAQIERELFGEGGSGYKRGESAGMDPRDSPLCQDGREWGGSRGEGGAGAGQDADVEKSERGKWAVVDGAAVLQRAGPEASPVLSRMLAEAGLISKKGGARRRRREGRERV